MIDLWYIGAGVIVYTLGHSRAVPDVGHDASIDRFRAGRGGPVVYDVESQGWLRGV